MNAHSMHNDLSYASRAAGRAAPASHFPSRSEAEAEQLERQLLTGLAILGLGGLVVGGALALKSKYSEKENRHD